MVCSVFCVAECRTRGDVVSVVQVKQQTQQREAKGEVERWVERLKHRSIVYSQATLTPELRKLIDHVLLGFIDSTKAI